MTHRVRIVGGHVFVAGELVASDLVVEGDRIAGVVERDATVVDAEHIDATGRVVLPGIIDLHAHTREPGYTNKEDFLTASMAGAAGGVTTMIDMPNVEPPTDTVARFEAKRTLADEKSILDWGHFVAGTNLDQLRPLAEAGATGYKIFQVSGAYPHDPRLALNDDGRLLKAFHAIAETGLPCVVHPFNQSLFEELSAEAIADGQAPDAKAFARVYTTEAIWHTAVNTLINLQALSGVRLHLVHSHSAGSLRLIRAAKARGQRVTAAIDPKYYHLTTEDLDRDPPRACPGGFVTEDRERMAEIWQALNDGTIDAIDADHAPHTLEEIAAQTTNAWTAAMGSPQYDWQYSITLTDVAAGKLSLARAVELLAEGPARVLGIYPKKGALLPGSDADLVVVDLERQTTLTDEGLFTKVHWTPYLNWTVTGFVELTMLRGSVIARNREIVGQPGYGQYIPGTPQ